MLLGCTWRPAVPSLLTLYMACTPCTASTSHVAWDIDDLLGATKKGESGGPPSECTSASTVQVKVLSLLSSP
jgi:hypothetical protein